MKQFLTRGLYLCLIAFVTISCGSDDPTPSGAYANGIFVINEGNFTDADGSVSFYNRETSEVEHTLFQLVNGEAALGDVIQSACKANDKLYLVANNSNRIEVVNASTFEFLFSITTDLSLPRYAVVNDGKLYVTEWGTLDDAYVPTEGNLVIFDAENGSFIEKITLNKGSEQVQIANNKAYVTNTTGTLSIVDLSNNEVSHISLNNGPKSVVVDGSNNVWVACGGGYGADWSPTNDGAIFKIDTQKDEIVETIELNKNFSASMGIDDSGNSIYYFDNNEVYTFDVSSPALPSSSLFKVASSSGFYGMGVDPTNGNILVTDAKDYVQDGEVYVYSATGNEVTSFTAGRIPNGFIFN